jgi:hypothetical protein
MKLNQLKNIFLIITLYIKSEFWPVAVVVEVPTFWPLQKCNLKTSASGVWGTHAARGSEDPYPRK